MKRPGLRLSVRLALAFGLLLALELAAVAAGLYQLEAVNLLRLEQARWELARHQIEGWSAHTRAGVLAAVAQARAGRVTPGPAWAEAEMKSSSRQAAALRTRLAQAVTDEAGQALLAKAQAALADYESAQQPAIAAQAYLQAAASLVGHVQDRFAASQAAFEAGLRRLYIGLPAVFALATLLGVLLAWALLRSLLAPIRQSVRHAQSLAQGDLSVDLTVSRRDELGDLQGALAQTQRELRALVASVRCGTDQLAAASSQMASGNQDLSERTGRAAGSLLQTTAAVAQLNGMIRESADAADTANELAGSAASVAQRGAEVVSQVVSTMQAINDGSRRISEITSVIDDIAFQTGILALNAAVEAARAGEQGRGFAVVAAEVRSLAGRSAQAAQEIKTLIGASVRRVDDGSRLVEVAGATMHDIEQSVQRVARAITEVTMAAGGQTMSVGEMNQAVRQLDEITQQNAALVEQSAAVARSLKSQADGLGGMVAMFRLAPRAGPA